MPVYEHKCRACKLQWDEEYSFRESPPDTCPMCASKDVFRCVTTAGVVHFKGAGWSSDGYYKNAPLEAHKGRIKVYDRKDDFVRENVGEAKEREKKKLLKQNEVIKKTLGPTATITEAEAERKIKKAGEKARNEI